MNWLDPYQNPLIIFVPLALGFSPIALSLFQAAKQELAARAGRHRGAYLFADRKPESEKPQVKALAGARAGGSPEGHFVWEGSVYIPTLADEPNTVMLTLTPNEGLMSIPALIPGDPPPVLTDEDIERITQQAIEAHKAERLAEINSVLYQHERVYHPLVAA
jgi:hypothetical protein